MSVTLRDKNRARANLSKTYRDENWYGGIADYINGKYAELEYRVRETFRYVAPDPSINRYTHSPEFANIIREAGTIFDSTTRNLITKSGNSHIFDCKIHGFMSFLKKYDPYLEERPVLVNVNKTQKFIFPFERSAIDDTRPTWWIAYTNLKHREIEAYSEGNFENTLNSVAAVAILSNYIKIGDESRIFAIIGLIDTNMERLFSIE